MHNVYGRLLSALSVALIITSCGGGGDTPAPAPAAPVETATQSVGTDGGSLGLTDPKSSLNGLKLEIPKGALAAATTITVSRSASITATALSGLDQIALSFTPTGTQFNAVTNLAVPYVLATGATTPAVYSSNEQSGGWDYVEGVTYDSTKKLLVIPMTHFSQILILNKTVVPPKDTYAYSIDIDETNPANGFTAAEAAAIEAEIASGRLAPFYPCSSDVLFQRVPKTSSPVVSITRDKRSGPPGYSYFAGFKWDSTFTKATLFVTSVNAATGVAPILYSGTGTVPANAYDLRTVIAHEISHFIGIASQDPAVNPGGLFQRIVPAPGSPPVQLGAIDKQIIVQLFPRCAAPVVTITPSAASTTINQSVTLTWSLSSYASSCTASGAWSGSKATSGSESVNVGASAATKTYSLTCVGPLGSGSASASLAVSAQACASIAGTWAVSDTATISCSGSFGSGSNTETATGNITISQNGCNISFVSPANTLRSGTINSNNAIQVSGAVALASAGVTFTQNRIDFTGTLASSGRRIDLTGSGGATGSSQGVPGSCTASSTEVLTR